jgi:GTP-binding protein
MKFIDEVKVTLGSGNGGAGSVSFRVEAMTPRGGPDGGDGGRGGDVIFKVEKNLNSLIDYRSRKKYIAGHGQPGRGMNCSGAAGADLIMKVPAGTIVRSLEGEVLVDMTDIETYTLLKGGRGGKGNTFFKTSINQAPEHAQPGESGELIDVSLELKLIADIGIVGFPNAGKSTLISRISAAKPKIADYPFTTLTPHLGVVKSGDFTSFVVADIPGLIEGAHQGVGLGIQFLKHIERTRFFIHLLDASGLNGRSALQDYEALNHELKMYDEQNKDKEGFFPLSNRKQFVVFNKIDLLSSDELKQKKNEFKKKTGVEPFAISAVTGLNIKEFVNTVTEKLFKESEL